MHIYRRILRPHVLRGFVLCPVVLIWTLSLVQTGMERPPDRVFVHSVYFWLNDSIPTADHTLFKDRLEEFVQIESVRSCYVGVPAGIERTTVDNTYDLALILHFEDKVGHDHYQAHKLHKDAIRDFGHWIEEMRIYDVLAAD